MISYWICCNSILGSLQYEINVSSVWYRTEYVGIPYWGSSVCSQCIFNMISYWIRRNSILGSLSMKSMYRDYFDLLLNMLEFHTDEPQYGINATSVWFLLGASVWNKIMNLQCDFILNMLEFQTEEPQYGINVTSVWFPTEEAAIPKYSEASVWNQCIFSIISYWTCWNSILRSLSMESMYLQYDFLLNMLEFHTEEPQYGINVTSVWFHTEYAGIPYWGASVWNQCNFSMISYWICCNSKILGSLSMKSMYLQ